MMHSKRLQFLVLLLTVILFNTVFYGLFLRFDITPEQPWRQSDSQSEIFAYAVGITDFIHPMVNAPRTQWGPGVIEIGFPIFQYTAAQLSKFIKPILARFLRSDYEGAVKLPFGMKLADYAEKKTIVDNRVIYTLQFTAKPTLEYRIATLKRKDIPKYLHLYLVARHPSSKQQCVRLKINENASLGGDARLAPPHEYCYGGDRIPIVYVPMVAGENNFQFTFASQDAPRDFASAFSLFPSSKYATPELLSGRIVNMLAIVGIALFFSCAFFPAGWFRFVAAISISAIPIFGVFASFIHEEIEAVLFVSIFLWIIFRKDLNPRWILLAALSLSMAVAIRPYYILYSLILAAWAFYQEKLEIFKRPIYYLAALITILPAVLWYSWTQYLVAHGADTIDIFNNRIFFSSLLNPSKWKVFNSFLINFHFSQPVFYIFVLTYIVFILLKFKKRIPFDEKTDIFLLVGLIISLIILPLIFDSAVHDYYSFPITVYMSFAALICFYRVCGVIQSVKWYRLLTTAFLIVVVFFGGRTTLTHFSNAVQGAYDPIDYAVLGSLTNELFQQNEKIILLDAGGPEVYGMANRFGRRDTGYYTAYPFKNIDDFQQYLIEYYGLVSTYHGVGCCESMLHRLATYQTYRQFLQEHKTTNKGDILYTYSLYTKCDIVRFSDNHSN